MNFIARMTVVADSLGPDDFRPMIEAGLDREAIEDVIYVCYLFNIYNRCADSFRFELQDDVGWANTAKHLLGRGYQ